MPDCYAVLKVSPEASPEEIRAAFRSLITHFHPDRSTAPQAHLHAAAIIEAYRTLSNPERRRAEDRRRARHPMSPGNERRQGDRRQAERGAQQGAALLNRARDRNGSIRSIAWAAVAATIIATAALPELARGRDLPSDLVETVAAAV